MIAGQLAVFLGGEGFGLKMGFDESYRDLGPGSVIIAETFREAIEEGLRGMDLLGDADPYKMRWTDQVRPRQRLRVVRGTPGKGRRARLEIAAPIRGWWYSATGPATTPSSACACNASSRERRGLPDSAAATTSRPKDEKR